MKISHKMILLFSAMILLLVSINTVTLSDKSIDNANESSAARYSSTAANMVHSLEQYVTMMDMAIEDFTSDTAFMEAFYQVSTAGDSDAATTLVNQNKMFQAMYHSPLADNFYRVCIFNESGFFLSSHIDRNDSVISLSDESREMIAAIPYLKMVKSAPYRRHLIQPHRDYFKVAQDVSVFSAIHAVTWHGQHIGYIEVASLTDELDNLLLNDNPDIMLRITFGDGSILYASPQDEAIYDDVPTEQFVAYTDPCGLRRYVYHIKSRWLGLDIYLAQDAALRDAYMRDIVMAYIFQSLVIALISLALVVIISLSLTDAIRRLNRKVRDLPVDHFMLNADTSSLGTFVTPPRDKEIHELESSFNNMLLTLHDATRNEMSMRENTLHAQLKALQTQINPHFVYNTLNIISAKGMESGNEDIINMCNQFAQMLRYSTDTRSDTATLGEDLNHVRNYLMLLKARYEDHLEYFINVPDEINTIIIPKLTLQPLVENAITHGFDGMSTTMRRVEISGVVRDKRLYLDIKDNGCGFSKEVLERLQRAIAKIEQDTATVPDNGGHIGLYNTCLRLYYYSKGAMRMRLLNKEGAVVRLIMKL